MKVLQVQQFSSPALCKQTVKEAGGQGPVYRVSSRVRSQARHRISAAADANDNFGEDGDLETKMEEFMRKQAELEGGVLAAPNKAVEMPVGTDVIPDEDAKQLCRDVVKGVKRLQERRDMTINEIKLVIAIEDPRARERRLSMGIEDGSGVSRDEMAAAYLDVMEGRIPKDRLALRELHREVMEWPFLEAEDKLPAGGAPSAGYAQVTDTGVSSGGIMGGAGERNEAGGARTKKIGRDPDDKPPGLLGLLPDWVGYGALYLVSGVPLIIGATVVVILFINSLR